MISKNQIKSRTEPWVGFWNLINVELNRKCLSLMLAENGEYFDYREALKQVQYKANHGLMFETPEEVKAKWRPLAFIILAVVVVIVAYTGDELDY